MDEPGNLAREQLSEVLSCSKCQRQFGSQRGLTQHRRKCDPEGMNEDRRVEAAGRRSLWSAEEAELLARVEFELMSSDDPPRFMNQALEERFPDRSCHL